MKIVMREAFLPFHMPFIENEEIDEVISTLKSGWLTTGPKTRAFEEAFKTYIGCRHAIAVQSGTSALHLALEAVGVSPGDMVIIPTLTFTATGEVVNYFGAKPVLMDVCENDFNIDPERVEAFLSGLGADASRVKAIIPVHFGGYPCNMERLIELAKAYDIHIVEDAAHALSAKYRGRPIGTLGDITAFSFYATKNITTGEGGMVTTENEAWAERIRLMSLHGMSKDAWMRYTAGGNWYYQVIEAGFKYNMTDMAAALGKVQLKRCDHFQKQRAGIAALYTRNLIQLDGIILPANSIASSNGSVQEYKHAWHLYPILLDLKAMRIDRNRFIDELTKMNIGVSVHFIPLHLHPYYQKQTGCREGDFPVSEYFFNRCISLPIYPRMSIEDTDDVISAVTKLHDRFLKC